MNYPHIPTEFQIPDFGDLISSNSVFDFEYKPNKKLTSKDSKKSLSTSGWITIILIVITLITLILVILIITGVLGNSEKGMDGKIGVDGPTGMDGPTGVKGADGYDGVDGFTGSTGSIGPTGQLNGNYDGIITAKGFSTGDVTSLGKSAGATGIYNTFVGTNAGDDVSTGNYNTFVGNNAGSLSTTCDYNTFVGRSAGGTFTSGDSNTVVGTSAGGSITTGAANVLIGQGAGRNLNLASSANIAIGYNAGPTVSTQINATMWLPKGSNALTPLAGEGAGVYLLAYNTVTGRVYPIDAGTVNPGSIPSD